MGALLVIAVKVVLAPIKAAIKLIARLLTWVTSIVSILTSIPTNILLIAGFVIIFVMWLYPAPFSIVYVLINWINGALTNIVIIATDLVVSVTYVWLAPVWNSVVDGWFIFWDMFKRGICEDEHNYKTCDGWADLMEILHILWAWAEELWSFAYFLLMVFVTGLQQLYIEASEDLRRDPVKIEYCHNWACDEWDGTPHVIRGPDGNIRYRAMPDESSSPIEDWIIRKQTKVKYLPVITATWNLRSYLTKPEIQFIQILARIAIAAWEVLFRYIIPFFIVMNAWAVDMLKVTLYYLEKFFEEFIMLFVSVLGKLFYVIVRAVESVTGGSDYPDEFDFNTTHYKINITEHHSSQSDVWTNFTAEYMLNITRGSFLLNRVTVGDPHVIAFFLKILYWYIDFLWYVGQIPETLLMLADKLLCVTKHLWNCIPFEQHICGTLFAPPSLCTVGQPICLQNYTVDLTASSTPDSIVIVPGMNILNDKTLYPNPWVMFDTLDLLLYGYADGASWFNPFDNSSDVIHGCRNYRAQREYGENIYEAPWWSRRFVNDTYVFDEININGIYYDANPELLQCKLFNTSIDFVEGVNNDDMFEAVIANPQSPHTTDPAYSAWIPDITNPTCDVDICMHFYTACMQEAVHTNLKWWERLLLETGQFPAFYIERHGEIFQYYIEGLCNGYEDCDEFCTQFLYDEIIDSVKIGHLLIGFPNITLICQGYHLLPCYFNGLCYGGDPFSCNRPFGGYGYVGFNEIIHKDINQQTKLLTAKGIPPAAAYPDNPPNPLDAINSEECDNYNGNHMRWCGKTFQIASHGILFPWYNEIEDLLNHLGLGQVWGAINTILHIINDIATQLPILNIPIIHINDLWFDLIRAGIFAFDQCQKLLGGNTCPCSKCETDKSQLAHWLAEIFSFGTDTGFPGNPSHPDPAKKCISVDPPSLLKKINEHIYEFYDECEICPTQEFAKDGITPCANNTYCL